MAVMPRDFWMRRISTHLLAQQGVQIGKRLVEQQDLRTNDQTASQCHPLLLSAERRPGARLEGLEANEIERLHDPGFNFRRANLAHAQPVGDVIEDIKVRKEAVGLEDRRCRSGVRRQKSDILAADADLAARRQLEAGNHSQHGGLATSGGPEQGDEFAAGNLQLSLIHRIDVGFGLDVRRETPWSLARALPERS